MKTTILTTALVVIATLAFAQTEPVASDNDLVLSTQNVKAVVYSNSSDQITLILDKEPGEKVKIRVREGNNLLYQKTLKKVDNTRVRYDVSEFPSGEYTFELVKDNEVIYSHKFEKRESTIAFIN